MNYGLSNQEIALYSIKKYFGNGKEGLPVKGRLGVNGVNGVNGGTGMYQSKIGETTQKINTPSKTISTFIPNKNI